MRTGFGKRVEIFFTEDAQPWSMNPWTIKYNIAICKKTKGMNSNLLLVNHIRRRMISR